MGKVVIAPDSFKGSIGAADAAAALGRGWARVRPDDTVVYRPMADGGEGTIDAFAASVSGSRRIPVSVVGPDGVVVDTSWLLLPDGTGVVELASTSGLEFLGDARLPWDASTLGFGQAIAAALDFGVSALVLGIGSSASTDGGVGMLTALGAQVLDASGARVAGGARGLADAVRVDLSGLRALPPGGAVVLGDVTNPLLGEFGAAAVFGPQKGFAADEVERVDGFLAAYAALFGADPAEPGTGAAGGTGFGLRVWGATIERGSTEVAALVGLSDDLIGASAVITGEGSFDGQSAGGKAPAEVAALAAAAGVPVLLAAGRIAADASAFAGASSLTELAGSSAAALADSAHWLEVAGERLAEGLDSAR